MTLPNFLILGAAKCGTDSLCNYLAQHPDIYIPRNREPSFFVAEGQPNVPYTGPGDRAALESLGMWISSLEEYERLFADATTERAIGEGTAWYIYYPEAPGRIRQYVPQAKLITVLRNPVDRAYSAYTMLVRDGRETIGDFSRALAAEEDRTRRNWEPIWHYLKMGFYAEQLKRYYATFDARQMLVIVYDDYNARPRETLQEIFRFLEVDDSFAPDMTTRYNVSAVPKNMAMHTLVAGDNRVKSALKAVVPSGLRKAVKDRIVQRNLTRPAPVDPALRRDLSQMYRADILELETMLGRDLSGWLAQTAPAQGVPALG